MTRGANKHKREATANQSQPTEQNIQLITDTDFHVGNQHPRTFHQIYEEFKAGQAQTDRKECEVWENVRKRCFPQIAARPAMFPYTDIVSWVLD